MVRDGHIRWTFYRLGGEHAHRRAWSGFPADAATACFDCRSRDLFLCWQTVVANEPDFFLPALENRSGPMVAMAIPSRSIGPRDRPRRRRSSLPRAVGRLSHFLWDAFPCARFSQCLSFPLLLCRRPLSVSGKPGNHRSANVGACTRDRADLIAKGRYHRLLHVDPDSWRTDLAAKPYVSRYRDPLPRIACTQSGQLAGAL